VAHRRLANAGTLSRFGDALKLEKRIERHHQVEVDLMKSIRTMNTLHAHMKHACLIHVKNCPNVGFMTTTNTNNSDKTTNNTLAIFGATGGVGRAAVEQALEAGHRVRALVRGSADRLGVEHPNLTILSGDVTDELAVSRTLEGVNAVICCLGAPAMSKSKVRSAGTEVIAQAMKSAGIERLLCVSLLGAQESRKELPFFLRYFLFPFYLRRPAADHETQEQIIEATDLNWTIVRPPFLTDGPATGDYAHGFIKNRGLTLKISRADVADFMLREISSSDYSHRAVGLSYAQ